jgi:branched-chain amino acid transport system ATP-binding protein
MSRLVVEKLSIRFGGVMAVQDVSFTVEPGEIFAVIGPNGAGKSTVFNLISRLYEPSGGSIRYGEHDLLRHRADQITGLGIARTFQNIELFENATVLQNLLVGRHRKTRRNLLREMVFPGSLRREEHAARLAVEEVIDLLDLAHIRHERIRDLPYGARKNVEIARALCSEPRLLLLDEPASGLNHEETDDLAFWLEDIRADLDVTLVMVEHDMGLVNRMADRVLALHNGQRLALGTPDEVRADPAVQEAYLGSAA